MSKVYVYIWFDVEDYVSTETEEPVMGVLVLLDKHKVKATCKLVAEKVRVMKQRGREDVINALKRQDVGFHLDTHSRHPTIYEYLADKDVEAGGHEFEMRERAGYEYVKATFGRPPSCFGHPGPAWAPQVYPGMRRLNIPVYLDETSILNLNDSPYYYCNVLNLNGAGRNFVSLDYFFEDSDGINRIERQYRAIYRRLVKHGGGVVSILLHPHTIFCKKFWDEVNFGLGRNSQNEEYVQPPSQLPEVRQRAYKDLDKLLSVISSMPQTEFITASDAVNLFKDRSTAHEYDQSDLRTLANALSRKISYTRLKECYVSASEGFYLIVSALASYAKEREIPTPIRLEQPLGPLARAKTRGSRRFASHEFLEICERVLHHMQSTGYIPNEILIRRSTLRPEDYLVTAARLLSGVLKGKTPPSNIVAGTGNLAARHHISRGEFSKACRWAVLPEHFKAPTILEQAVLQTWTVKPAILRGS